VTITVVVNVPAVFVDAVKKTAAAKQFFDDLKAAFDADQVSGSGNNENLIQQLPSLASEPDVLASLQVLVVQEPSVAVVVKVFVLRSPLPPPPPPPEPPPPPPKPPSPRPPPPPMCSCDVMTDNANLFSTCLKVENQVRICKYDSSITSCPSDFKVCPGPDFYPGDGKGSDGAECKNRKKKKNKCKKKALKGKCGKPQIAKKCRKACGLCS